MKWFRHWLRRIVSKAVDEDQANCMKQGTVLTVAEEIGEKKINFTMYFAEGGIILQQYHYDHQKDRSFKKLILIHEDEDVAEKVGQHVAMEILRV